MSPDGCKFDLGKHAVPLTSSWRGPPQDGIAAIDEPAFVGVDQAYLVRREPVIRLTVGGEARVYPIQLLIWHETVKETSRTPLTGWGRAPPPAAAAWLRRV